MRPGRLTPWAEQVEELCGVGGGEEGGRRRAEGGGRRKEEGELTFTEHLPVPGSLGSQKHTQEWGGRSSGTPHGLRVDAAPVGLFLSDRDPKTRRDTLKGSLSLPVTSTCPSAPKQFVAQDHRNLRMGSIGPGPPTTM